MQPIVTNINAPSYDISKRILSKLQQYPFPESLRIKNNFELAEKLADIELEETNWLISFDVQNLFPSVLIPGTLEIIEKWLKNQGMDKRLLAQYMESIKLCYSQTIFQFKEIFHKQTGDTAMVNPLFPFLADIFKSDLETKIKKENKKFPKAWFPYVDNMLCIIQKDFDIQGFLNHLNNIYPNYKIYPRTREIEQNPF